MTFNPETESVTSRDGVTIFVDDMIALPYAKEPCLVARVGEFGLQAYISPTMLREVPAAEIDERFVRGNQPEVEFY